MQALMDTPLDMPRRDSEESSSGDEVSYLSAAEFSSPVKKDEYKDGSSCDRNHIYDTKDPI